jgi:hypothetical protein
MPCAPPKQFLQDLRSITGNDNGNVFSARLSQGRTFVNPFLIFCSQVAFSQRMFYNFKEYIREVRQMKKRIIAILLALCMLFSVCVCFAEDPDDDFGDDELSDDELSDDDFDTETDNKDFRDIAGFPEEESKTFKTEDGLYSYQFTADGKNTILVGYDGDAQNVIVPDSMDGYPLVGIGPQAFNYKSYIETVELPDGLIYLGNMAFFQCINLKRVNIPEGVISIEECCFGGCEALSDIEFPLSLESVGRFSFLKCLNLTEVSFGESLKEIGPGAFMLCASLSKVSIPGGDNVSIEADSFAQCSPDLEITN